MSQKINKHVSKKDVYRKGKFSIDSLENAVFDGYTNGDKWNGFACPVFPKESVEKIIKQFKKGGDTMVYDKKTDTYILKSVNHDDEEFEGFDIVVNGKKVHVYGIGTYGWIWDEEK